MAGFSTLLTSPTVSGIAIISGIWSSDLVIWSSGQLVVICHLSSPITSSRQSRHLTMHACIDNIVHVYSRSTPVVQYTCTLEYRYVRECTRVRTRMYTQESPCRYRYAFNRALGSHSTVVQVSRPPSSPLPSPPCRPQSY